MFVAAQRPAQAALQHFWILNKPTGPRPRAGGVRGPLAKLKLEYESDVTTVVLLIVLLHQALSIM